MPALQIGGVTMPAPDIDSMEVIYQDLDSENSGRGEETGIMIRERIRANVRKFSPSWSMLTGTELNSITAAIAAAQFSVTLLDPLSGISSTMNMYAGDRNIKCIVPAATHAESLYRFSVPLIEC